MIILGSNLNHAPVVSIQTSGEVAHTERAIIDPADLRVLAYSVTSALLPKTPQLMRIADVRELSSMGFIVDSIDEFVAPSDVIDMQKIYDLQFDLLGMRVIDQRRHKLGKIIDFTIDTNTFLVQQLTVKRPLFRSLNDTELLIHRSQIIEINNDEIVVHSETKAPEPELHEVVGSYVNPFRKANPAKQSINEEE